MGTHALNHCQTSCIAHRPRRRRSGVVARITGLVLALGACVLAFSGEHWMLAEAPRAANELTLAACALDDVYDAHSAAVCLYPQPNQGHTL